MTRKMGTYISRLNRRRPATSEAGEMSGTQRVLIEVMQPSGKQVVHDQLTAFDTIRTGRPMAVSR